jgi:hypothetical protein
MQLELAIGTAAPANNGAVLLPSDSANVHMHTSKHVAVIAHLVQETTSLCMHQVCMHSVSMLKCGSGSSDVKHAGSNPSARGKR